MSLWLPDSRMKPPAGQAVIDWSHPLTRGLVGCWHFGEYGQRAYDIGPQAAHGIPDLASQYTPIASPMGPALSRGNGWDRELVVPERDAFKLTDAFTQEMYLRGPLPASTQYYWRNEASASAYYWRIAASSIPRLVMTIGDGTNDIPFPYDSYIFGLWQHIVYTWCNSDHVRLYIDGRHVATSLYNTTLSLPSGYNYHWFQSNYPYSGDIAYARCWNRQLSAGEASALYDAPFSIFEARRRPTFFVPTAGGEFEGTATAASLATVGAQPTLVADQVIPFEGDAAVSELPVTGAQPTLVAGTSIPFAGAPTASELPVTGTQPTLVAETSIPFAGTATASALPTVGTESILTAGTSIPFTESATVAELPTTGAQPVLTANRAFAGVIAAAELLVAGALAELVTAGSFTGIATAAELEFLGATPTLYAGSAAAPVTRPNRYSTFANVVLNAGR